ncbi:MAG: hypothetical protein JWO90_3106 [Solirubrobacterales bacterium]|jgi:phospholipid/cholesterol/gamma-HCH transport system substrate-binding protein|nr:hypothetical protein [Solirubrobacterales bacterium]
MRIDNRGGKIFGLALFTVVCLGIFVYLFQAAGGRLRVNQPYTVKALVPSAFQLTYNGDVRMAGVKVGQISKITNKGAYGVVSMELEDERAPLAKDSTVQVRTKTLVGENYMEIVPGKQTAGPLENGGTLPIEQAKDAIQLDEILDTLDAGTRREVQRNLDGLGPGVKGRGADINRLFAALPPTATQGDRTLGLLKAQRAQVAAIVDNTGAVMQAFADRTQQVRTLARQGKATAIAVRDRDEQFGAALRELPPTLERARSSVANLASFATNATPVMRDLSVAFKDLTPVMRDLTPAARSTRELFDELPPFLDVVDPALEQLSPFAEQLRPAVGSTDAFLRQVNPALEFLQPYREELGSFFPNAGSAVDATDAVGHLGRVHAVIAPSSFTGLDANTKKALDALIAAGGLSQLVGEKVNGYPRPGTVGEPDTKSNFRQVATPGGK